jgi:hypothetical protein
VSDAVSRLVDERDVLDTVHRFAAGMDGRDWSAFRAMFTDEVVIDYSSYRGGEPVTMPADAWVARVRRRFDTLTATQHSLSNARIEVDGDQATCHTYVQAMHVGLLDGVQDWCLVGGEYCDQLVRTSAGWRIRAKRLDARWTIGNPAVINQPTS